MFVLRPPCWSLCPPPLVFLHCCCVEQVILQHEMHRLADRMDGINRGLRQQLEHDVAELRGLIAEAFSFVHFKPVKSNAAMTRNTHYVGAHCATHLGVKRGLTWLVVVLSRPCLLSLPQIASSSRQRELRTTLWQPIARRH